jgi:hypothetical protein
VLIRWWLIYQWWIEMDVDEGGLVIFQDNILVCSWMEWGRLWKTSKQIIPGKDLNSVPSKCKSDHVIKEPNCSVTSESSHVVYTWLCSTTLQLWSASMVVKKLSWMLDWLKTWNFSFLACTLTWLGSSQFSLWGYLKIKVYASTVNTVRGTVELNSTICKWNKEYAWNLLMLASFFFKQRWAVCPRTWKLFWELLVRKQK